MGIAILHFFLDFVTGISAGRRRGDRRRCFTFAAAYLVAEHAANDGTCHGSGDLLRIPGRIGHIDNLVMTDFTRHTDRCHDGLD